MISLPTIPAWVGEAACDPSDPEAWQPNKDRPTRAERPSALKAKAICATCPALALCRDDAIKNNERHGIWGGLTTAERDHYKTLDPAAQDRFAAYAVTVASAITTGPDPEPEDDAREPEHGTVKGYRRHQRHRQPQCDECRAAWAADRRRRRGPDYVPGEGRQRRDERMRARAKADLDAFETAVLRGLAPADAAERADRTLTAIGQLARRHGRADLARLADRYARIGKAS